MTQRKRVSSYNTKSCTANPAIFINLSGSERPDYYIVPSYYMAKHGSDNEKKTGSTWYWFRRDDAERFREGWTVLGKAAKT